MSDASFVAGDWGTSHLRLFLCDSEGRALAGRSGPGAAGIGGRFAEAFDSLTAGWEESHGALPAVLCGMVGSSIGWFQAPYVACPATPEQIIDACAVLRGGRIHIVPGLSCRNRLDAPDFLRGEETQILGALHLVPALRQGCWLLCHPGTHTKWVVLQDGWVREFLTAPTGEMFAVLRDHSVLVRKPEGAKTPIDENAFHEGLSRFNESPEVQLLHRLFECRSRQLSGELGAQSADGYLSGLLIACDVLGAMRLLPDSLTSGSVCVIGSAQLTRLYAAALGRHGHAASQIDGAEASRVGLAHVHRRLSQAGPSQTGASQRGLSHRAAVHDV
jgi:2-dehydro-3-deoxygalactonokinase